MGLLEKAGKISEDEKKEEKPAASVAKVEPEPVAPKPKKSKKAVPVIADAGAVDSE